MIAWIAYWGSVALCVFGVICIFNISTTVTKDNSGSTVAGEIAQTVLLLASAVIWKYVWS